jgi:hypothetical protein
MKAPPSPPAPDLTADVFRDARDRFIREVVAGKSFCDVGGLWGTVRERVSVAVKAGASMASMLDVTPVGDPLWRAFGARMLGLSVPEVHCLTSDLHQYDGAAFDVVHCSGVLYHCPEPEVTLAALRRLTRHHLILSCSVIPPELADGRGWVPLWQLTADDAAHMADYWRPAVSDTAIGLTRDWPTEPDPDNWAPWYWLPTINGLTASVRAHGFTVLNHAPIWHGYAHTWLLQVTT